MFILSGQIETQALAELRRLFERQSAYCDIILDLKDVSLAGREGILFLARCEADGVTLENCTPLFANGWREKGATELLDVSLDDGESIPSISKKLL